ncbi:MAG: phosphatidylglycerophosphatase A [Myxococcales bacterium]|nr:phosphatidylglycerophosphatase A [Myxococcales bacterium]
MAAPRTYRSRTPRSGRRHAAGTNRARCEGTVSDSTHTQRKRRLGARDAIAVALATWAGVGFLPGAPGTWASLCVIVIFVLFSPFALVGWAIGCAVVTALGVWASGRAEQVFNRSDDGRIVIDEIAGQGIALLPLAGTPMFATTLPPAITPGEQLIVGVVTAFVAFRCFDIWKPGPIRRADRGEWSIGEAWGSDMRNGVSVMLDDVLAGLAAAVVVIVCLIALSTVGGLL